jgi:hypothetical protein
MIGKCLNCKKIIYVKPSEIGRKKYCSDKCLHIHKSSWVTCYTCGKKFNRQNSKIQKHPFCNNKCKYTWTRTLVGNKHNCWKGGVRTSAQGYRYLFLPNHPHKILKNYYAEHRYICEQVLGRYLTRRETPHHINENKGDNRPENLYLFPTPNKHISYHNILKTDETMLITKSNLPELLIQSSFTRIAIRSNL